MLHDATTHSSEFAELKTIRTLGALLVTATFSTLIAAISAVFRSH